MSHERASLKILQSLTAITLISTGIGTVSAQDGLPLRVAFVQVPLEAKPSTVRTIGNTILASRYVDGSRLMIAPGMTDFEPLPYQAERFDAAADPVFSHDGQRVFFAARVDNERPFQIWSLENIERDPRQITDLDADCITPVIMPSGHLVFASLLAGEYEEHGGHASFSLYDFRPQTREPTRLTFNPSSDFDPVVLPDGRLAYSAWQHVGNHHWPRGMVSLMLINSDGTGLFPLTGNHEGDWLKRAAVPFGDQELAFITTEDLVAFGAGALMTTSFNDSFSAYATLVPPEFQLVESAVPMDDGRFLIASKPAADIDATFGLYILERDGSLTLLFDDPNYHELSPALGAPQPKPDLRSSTVVPDTPHGYLLTLNCRETDREIPNGRSMSDIASVRLIEGLPLRHDGSITPTFTSIVKREDEPRINPGSATGAIPSRILGETTPAADGSVFLKVPADRPLRMQLLDDEGFPVMNERAWFWVRPNERRVCIGCHEHRELSPANVSPMAVREAPIDLTDPGGWRTVTFRNDIEPILSANCTNSGCHIPPRPTAAMNLSSRQIDGTHDAPLTDLFGPAYANLLQRQVDKPFAIGGRRIHPGDSRSSPLMWMLYGQELAPQYKSAPFDRPLLAPHPDTPLTDDEIELIRIWIDLGALYDDSTLPVHWPTDDPMTSQSTQGADR